MARTQNRKRQRADDPSQEQHPAKKTKLRREGRSAWNHPPEFYDSLSKVWLTPLALRELDRRNNIQPPTEPCVPASDYSTDLARFARRGGPDLHHLRGYQPKAIMSSSSSRSRTTESTNLTSNLPSKTPKSKSISPYSRNFEQYMIDHHVYRDDRAEEAAGRDETLQAMAVPRASLSPSRFDQTTFKAFRSSDARAKDEDDVLLDVIPYIMGPNKGNHFAARKTAFTNLDSFGDGLAPANPDLYYGSRPEQLDREVRDKLNKRIIPLTMDDKPMAPNFFMEVKGPDGSAAVVARQALYDGTLGARGMHSLQSYGPAEPTYDGKAYTYSSTYHAGMLKLYEHHVAASTTEGGQPEYHMTQLNSYAVTGNKQAAIEGIGAFRNLRELAEDHRNKFIATANARARGSRLDNPASAAEVQQDDGSSPGEFVDCEEYPDDDGRTPQYTYLEDDDQDESQASIPYYATEDPAASVATSFTSSFTSGSHSHKGRSKRHRNSQSPPSGSHHPKKHHTHSKSTQIYQSQPAGSRKGKGKASSSNARGVQENRAWNPTYRRWEYLDEEYQAWKYWGGERWHWVE